MRETESQVLGQRPQPKSIRVAKVTWYRDLDSIHAPRARFECARAKHLTALVLLRVGRLLPRGLHEPSSADEPGYEPTLLPESHVPITGAPLVHPCQSVPVHRANHDGEARDGCIMRTNVDQEGNPPLRPHHTLPHAQNLPVKRSKVLSGFASTVQKWTSVRKRWISVRKRWIGVHVDCVRGIDDEGGGGAQQRLEMGPNKTSELYAACLRVPTPPFDPPSFGWPAAMFGS